MPKLRLFLLCTALMFLGSCAGCDTRHKATIYKLKNHHIAMKDDQGKWYEYVLKNMDIDYDIGWNNRGEILLPSGGSWRPATIQEEEEAETEATNAEETSVDEATAEDGSSSPDGSGDVGGDSGGAGGDSGSAGDGGADGGGDGGGD
jgi:uncharacterized membrane protein YgcG